VFKYLERIELDSDLGGLDVVTFESIMAIDNDLLPEAAKKLGGNDVAHLVEWLSLKDDDIRYRAFQLLQHRSALCDDVYPYWDTLRDKLKSDNSYQRSIGVMLIAENVRWDAGDRIEGVLNDLLELLNDEKPITIRQCIQSLGKIASAKPTLLGAKIAGKLVSFNIMAVKETMRKFILLDILNVLLLIRKTLQTDEIEGFVMDALSGGILDPKSKKQIAALL